LDRRERYNPHKIKNSAIPSKVAVSYLARRVPTLSGGCGAVVPEGGSQLSGECEQGYQMGWRSTGSVAAKPMGGNNFSRFKGDDTAWVLALVPEPDLMLVEIRERLASAASASATGRSGDSSTATISGSRPCSARAAAGGERPARHWKTSTFVAALRCDGIKAPCVIDDAMNNELFRAHVKQFLVPTLKTGDIGVMDNLSIRSLVSNRPLPPAARNCSICPL
jgi:hypothetical protein